MRSEPSDRYQKSGTSAKLGVPIKVTRSKKYCPGGIFTLGTDCKTREWSKFHLDDIEAVPLPAAMKNDNGLSRLIRESPKCHDIVIPPEVCVKSGEELSKPFSTIPMKVELDSPPNAQPSTLESKLEMLQSQHQHLSSSKSVGSQSVSSQSTRSIFGPRNPKESYSLKGTKFYKNRLDSLLLRSGSGSHDPPHHSQPILDDDMFSQQSYESSRTTQQQGPLGAVNSSTHSPATFTELLNKSSHETAASEVIPADWPAHQIHSRMMGWKLTSPERRRDLLQMLETVDLSTASMSEEELKEHKKRVGEEDLSRLKHIAKRQAEAYEQTVSRLALHQNKEFKFSKNQLDNMKAKVNKLSNTEDIRAVDRVGRPCAKKAPMFKYNQEDPFINVDITRAYTAEAVTAVKLRNIVREAEATKVGLSSQEQEEENRALDTFFNSKTVPSSPGKSKRNIHTPDFQSVSRSQRAYLNPAERMELLSNARDVENTASSLSNLAAQIVEDYGGGERNYNSGLNIIGSGSPKRGLTGEAYLLSVKAGRVGRSCGGASSSSSGRKPVPVQTILR